MKSKIFSVVVSLECFRDMNEVDVRSEVADVVNRIDGVGINKIEVKETNKRKHDKTKDLNSNSN